MLYHRAMPAIRIMLLCAAILLLIACGSDEGVANIEGTETVQPQEEEAGPIGQAVVRGSEPVAFEFAPDGRLFFNLRQLGEIRWFDMDQWDPDSAVLSEGDLFATEEVRSRNECGLLGIAIDPDFSTNHYVYVYLTQSTSVEDVATLRVVRYTDVDGLGTDRTVLVELLDTEPGVCVHVGGGLHFGPDGYLYLSVGNNEQKQRAGGLDNPLGKFLRFDKRDGSPAPDNPFINEPGADPRIYAHGIRNTFDFAFHGETGVLYAPDNGPGNCDELNVIESGAGYGVPGSLPRDDADTCLGLGGVDPIYLFSVTDAEPEDFPSNVAPAGMAFLPEGQYEGLGNGLLICEFNTGIMRYLEFGGSDNDEIVEDLVLMDDCRFNVSIDSEGIIYYSSGDTIYRLAPELLPQP